MVQRGMMRRPVPSRGGQLEIAGVVVGQWGPNYGSMPPGRLPQPIQGHARGRLPPQVRYRMCNRSLTMVRRYRRVYTGQDSEESHGSRSLNEFEFGNDVGSIR